MKARKKVKPSQDTTPGNTKTSSTDVVRWVKELFDLHARIAPHFARPEPRRRALAYLQGVMSEVSRKNSWQLAEQAREGTPYGMQRLLATAVWDEARVRDELLNYVYEHLGTDEGIFVIDETSFPKRGEKSAGTQVQYCGTTGRLENCQVAVFLAYVTALGHTLIDGKLYIPLSWIKDPERCREAGIPDDVGFQTKCELAQEMLERIYQRQIPLSWVVADTVYGNNLDFRLFLEKHGTFYVVAVECREPIDIRAPDGLRRQVEAQEVEALLIKTQDWQRISMGEGTKGPRIYDWATTPILHQWEDDEQHWLLIRRCIDNPKIKTYYTVFAPKGTPLQLMVKIFGRRWRIEDVFKTSKAIGLDQYEVRRWICWYRHVTLVMVAHAFLAVICAKAKNASLVEVSPSFPIPTDRVVEASASVPPLMISAPKVPRSLSTLERVPLPQEASLPFLAPSKEYAPRSLSKIAPLAQEVSLLSLPPPIQRGPPAMSSPPVIHLAPLTVPEVRHLLARLIWPLSSNTILVFSWSEWRRAHQSLASSYHTKRRLDAG